MLNSCVGDGQTYLHGVSNSASHQWRLKKNQSKSAGISTAVASEVLTPLQILQLGFREMPRLSKKRHQRLHLPRLQLPFLLPCTPAATMLNVVNELPSFRLLREGSRRRLLSFQNFSPSPLDVDSKSLIGIFPTAHIRFSGRIRDHAEWVGGVLEEFLAFLLDVDIDWDHFAEVLRWQSWFLLDRQDGSVCRMHVASDSLYRIGLIVRALHRYRPMQSGVRKLITVNEGHAGKGPKGSI